MKTIGLTTVFAFASLALAQAPPPFEHPGGPGGFRVLGFEGGHPGKIVAGAPFSGKETTTETQTLANGTHITHTITVQMYRDASGRVRKESTITGVGSLGTGTPRTIIDIFDPVAHVSYSLDTTKQVAYKRTLPTPPTGASAPGSTGTGATTATERRGRFASSENVTRTTGEPKTVAGMSCTPTTTARTIPAGQIGNDQVLSVTETRCVSPDLQITLSSSRTDPRMGEVTSAFENIVPGAPDASLFAPPSGYTITTRPAFHRGGGPGGPPPAAPVQE